MENWNVEEIRMKFRPETVKLLLVGESPPSGDEFFYNDGKMTTYTSKSFQKALKITFSDNQEFLKVFKAKGCYLEDLCHEPIDKLAKKEREDKLRRAVPGFSEIIKSLEPPVLVIVLKKIEPFVREAIAQSGVNTTVYTIPFAGNGHQNKYMNELHKIIQQHFVEET